MIRYYLVPFETDKAKLIADVQPMHLKVFGVVSGLIPKSVSQSESIVTEWREEHYVVCVECETVNEYTEIEGLTDVVRLDANTELAKLEAKGIDTSLCVTRDDMDMAVTKWLVDDEKILSEILKPVKRIRAQK